MDACTEVLPPGQVHREGLLRCFERLRRALANRIEGNDGMFAGFDLLRFSEQAVGDDLPAFVQASVARRLDGSHCVDFIAVSCPPVAEHGPRPPAEVVVLAQAHGRTLSLACPRQTEPA